MKRIDITLGTHALSHVVGEANRARVPHRAWLRDALVARARVVASTSFTGNCPACGRLLAEPSQAPGEKRVRVPLYLDETAEIALNYLARDHHGGNRSRAVEDAVLHALGAP